jgi:broad specificity phosphatase PhoE
MIRSEHLIDFHLVRHTEAVKNIERRHGGGDQTLTPRGIKQAHNIGHYLVSVLGMEAGYCVVAYQPEVRSELTAQYANSIVKGKMRLVKTLSGIGLGVREGLSEDELEQQYPDVSRALVDWRTGVTSLQIPELPGSEAMTSFMERINSGIEIGINECCEQNSLMLVGTTSTLVMVNHLLVNDGNYTQSEYKYFDAPLGSVSSWKISDEPPVPVFDRIIPTVG